MNCKFCNAELPEGMTLCDACGKDNADEIVTEEIPEVLVTEEAAELASEAVETDEVTEEIPAGENEENLEELTEEPAEEMPVKKTAWWVKVLAVVGALALVAVLACAVIYGVNRTPKAESFTVSAQKADSVRDTVVATVGDFELTNNELQVFYWQGVEEFYNYYGYYIDSSILDLSKPLDTQFYDEASGVTWQRHFLDNALTTWSRYAALGMHAKEEGFDLSEETKAELETMPQQLEDMAVAYQYANAEEMLKADMGIVCNVDGYLAFLTTNLLAGQYLDSIYDSLVPTDAQIEAYYVENEEMLNTQGISKDNGITVDARHILICPKGGTEDENGTITYSEEEWEACREQAQMLLDQWLAEDGTEEGFAQYATMYTEDPGSMASGGLYTDMYEGQMVAPFEDWCFDASRQYGDSGLVKTTYGYHIMYFVESREIWISNVRDLMISDNSMAIVNEASAKWPVDVNYKKIALGDKPAAE